MPEDDPHHTDDVGDGGAGIDRDGDGVSAPVAVPDFVDARDQVVGDLVGFVRSLRAAGASVPANAARDGAASLSVVGLDDRERVETALKATFVADPRDESTFTELFPAFWHKLRASIADATAPDTRTGEEEPTDESSIAVTGAPMESIDATEVEAPGSAERGDGAPAGISGVETEDDADAENEVETTQRPFAYSSVGRRERPTSDGVRSGSLLRESDVRAFERAIATLPGRRNRRAAGPSVDRRRTLRRSLSTGGMPVVLPERTRAKTEFSPTVLVDVSRSVIDSIDRSFLLAFLARLHRDGRSARTFFFDTDLRDVTGVFDDARDDPARALEAASVEWGGGTRIGDAIQTLRRDHTDAVDRRRVVIVVSDGLDVGEQEGLRAGMAWLARRSRTVLWLNPLAASPGYEPTARGMATALPYVDGLFAFSESGDLGEIARQIRQRGLGGSLGYQYDSRRAAE